jgi:large subunit ribosomal protein L13
MKSGTPTVRAADIRHEWFLVDASDQVLGRLASDVAVVLSGKHRPGWVPHLDSGDFVVVTNAEKVKLTGRKEEVKVYRRHSGYPGGLKSVGASEMRSKFPERLVEQAVRGMLPKTKLGRRQLKKLKVYRGSSHPHEAQQPRPLARARSRKASKAAAPAAKA